MNLDIESLLKHIYEITVEILTALWKTLIKVLYGIYVFLDTLFDAIGGWLRGKS